MTCLFGGVTGIGEVLYKKRHDLNIDAAFLQPGNIHMAAWETIPDIQTFIEHTIGQVIVAIPNQSVLVQFFSLCFWR